MEETLLAPVTLLRLTELMPVPDPLLRSNCAQAHLIPAHSGLLQPKFEFRANLGPIWPE